MIPEIDKTSFGSITVDGMSYDHDIIITLDGEVKKRKKKLSKAVYGTSHKISLDEIRYTYQFIGMIKNKLYLHSCFP